jgi:hypothetical protein
VKPSGSVRERLFLVRDGALVPVVRHVPTQPTAEALVTDLLAAPDDAERAAGLTTALLGAPPVTAVHVVNGLAQVELAQPAEGATRNDDQLAYAQIVSTLTARPDITGVVFVRDGQPLGVPRGDGSRSTGPLTAADYANLISGN